MYLNDTIGNVVFDEISFTKDTIEPSISIISPVMGGVFGSNSPSFVVELSDNHIVDAMWYSLGVGNDTTYFMFTNNGTINQIAWNAFSNGSVNIIFYVNDSAGNMNSNEVFVRKDIIAPVITILIPEINEIFGRFAPAFQILIDDINLDQVWYSLNGLNNIAVTQFTGALSQTIWESLPEGPINLIFSANDTGGNIASRNVIIYKDLGVSGPDQPDMTWVFIMIGIIAGIAGVGITMVFLVRSRCKKTPKKKSILKEKAGEHFCPFCHSKIKPGQIHCDYCGNRLDK